MTRDIVRWLSDFKKAWLGKDVEGVMDLFTDDVEYFETPFKQFQSKDELRTEWESIKDQEDIDLELEIFNSQKNRYTVIWSLEYTQDGERFQSKGIYLLKLNPRNECFEFAQYPVTPE